MVLSLKLIEIPIKKITFVRLRFYHLLQVWKRNKTYLSYIFIWKKRCKQTCKSMWFSRELYVFFLSEGEFTRNFHEKYYMKFMWSEVRSFFLIKSIAIQYLLHPHPWGSVSKSCPYIQNLFKRYMYHCFAPLGLPSDR